MVDRPTDQPDTTQDPDLGTDVGEGWPGKPAKISSVPIRLADGTTIPGDSGPF